MTWADIIKQCTEGQINQMQLCNVRIGVVVQENPLEIEVDQRYILAAEALVLARQVTEHTIEMTVDHWTEDEIEHTHAVQDTYTGGGTSSPTAHRHAYQGRKKFIVHNGLKNGEKVLMVKASGGQRHFVIDRIEGSP